MASTPIFKRFTRAQAFDYVDALCVYVNTLTQAANVFAEVAKQYDGKVYNKRFVNAVQAVLDETCGVETRYDNNRPYEVRNVSIGVDSNSIYAHRFNLHVSNRSVKIGGAWIYFDGEFMNDIACGFESHFYEGRIIASRFAEAADALVCTNLRKLNRFIDAVRNWDVYVAKLKEIDAYLLAQTAEMNPLFVRNECRTLHDYDSLYLNAFDTYQAKHSK